MAGIEISADWQEVTPFILRWTGIYLVFKQRNAKVSPFPACLPHHGIFLPSLRAYRNLSPKTRAGVGLAVITWGVVGLYISDRAEEKFGYTPSDADKEELWKWAPKVITVEKPEEK